MFAPPCLDRGLLIDAEHVIAWPQCCTFPAALIQIDDAASLRANCGSRGKIQLRWRQGRNASWPSQRQSVVPLIWATMPQATASRRSSATDQRARGRPCRDGSSHANALIATTTLGGKVRRSPAARPIVQTGQPIGTEPLAPLAGNLTWHAKLGRYDSVANSLASQQYDLRPYHVAVRDVYSLQRASSSLRSCSVSRITKGLVSACILLIRRTLSRRYEFAQRICHRIYETQY